MHCTALMPTQSRHSLTRAKQRGVPPVIIQWLSDYGEEVYDGHGGVVLFFSGRSRRDLEKAIGREVVRRMSEFLRCYLVESSGDGTVITVGKLYRNSPTTRPR